MRHNIRDSKGRFIKKGADTGSEKTKKGYNKEQSKCTCAECNPECCTCEYCKESESHEYPERVKNFVHAAITTAVDITMSPCTDIEKIARTELDYDKLPEDLAEDLKAIGAKTIYDFGQYIVVARSLINDAIEQMGFQLMDIVKK